MSESIMRILTIMLCVICVSNAHGHPFEAGQTRVSAGGGGGVGGWSLGVAAGYFMAEGLEVGLGSTYIRSDDLSLVQVTGSTTYVFLPTESWNPYTGGFARHWFVADGDVEPKSSVGVRGGFYSRSGHNLLFGLGAVYEVIVDCEPADECTSTYPEFSLSLIF